MNKLGFTLIELLSSITIMGLIAAITSFNMVGIFEEKKKMQEETQNSLMTTAACLYIELEDNIDLKNTCLKNGCTINTNTLINAGLLNEEDVPKNKNITIKKENNVKTCTIAN